ncbi:unnamed protein product [Bursaphelenchus okinawaensis]|uniref:Uncharacterized protein n=1 Tax=Bursaphelenchus okinawaensis TaxID=465554 RepID=A0A811LTC9_9BILA|nr:unnamed protein product [Bursaphelenchus okinawaensis]CAG9128558.1 unnamed protein product [Bursaphelenchus okinawaensis]
MGITIIPRVIVWFLVVMAKTMYRLVIPYRFQKKKSLKGKKVILTGACGGLGSAFARALAKEGCHLALWDINELGLKKLKMDLLDQHDIDVFTQVVDIANEQEVIQKSNELKSLFGEINMVFNNAGVINVTPLLETSTELLEKLIHVNLMSHYYIIKQFLPTMIERNEGHIVATCSAAGHICPSEVVDYTGSKFAVRGYMEALYHQMLAAGHNIEFTTICPW